MRVVRNPQFLVAAPLMGLFVLAVWALHNNRIVITRVGHQQEVQPQPIDDALRPPISSDLRPVRVVDETNPIPLGNVLDSMSIGQLSDLYHGYVLSSQALCNRVLRMGRVADGGWDVCDDPKFKPIPNDCLVYSFGISRDWSFDDAIETHYGCEVHAYDPSLTQLNDHTRGKMIHFHRVGIGGQNTNTSQGWPLYTLGTLRKQNGHLPVQRRVDIVKMDVEAWETTSLNTALDEGSLKDVPQLYFETHMKQRENDPERERITGFLKLFHRLWNAGFRLYHAHRNTAAKYVSKIHQVERSPFFELYMVNIRLSRK